MHRQACWSTRCARPITGWPSARSVLNRIAMESARASALEPGDALSLMKYAAALGTAPKIDWVEVRWPGGHLERFENVGGDAVHTIKEGTGAALNSAAKKN